MYNMSERKPQSLIRVLLFNSILQLKDIQKDENSKQSSWMSSCFCAPEGRKVKKRFWEDESRRL